MSRLSKGSIKSLRLAEPDDSDIFNDEYTLQFLAIKNVGSNPATSSSASLERYRIMVSDGVHYTPAMLATWLNDTVHSNSITRNTIAIVDKFACNYVREKKLLIVLSFRVVEHTANKIGNPQQFDLEDEFAKLTAVKEVGSTASKTSTVAVPMVSEPSSAEKAMTPSRLPETSVFCGNLYPIESLTPYQNDWTIKARIKQKSDIKTFSNTYGEGKFFDVVLIDDSGEIRGTCFNLAVDNFYPKLEEGKTYIISKAQVNIAKKKFSNLNNDYELCFDQTTEIQECQETNDLPTVEYKFTPLNMLQELSKDSVCDVIGIIKETLSLSEITSSKQNRQIAKRDLILVDKSGFSVRLTLWGKTAMQYNVSESYPVIAFRGVKVGDFGGRCLSTFSSSNMQINPDIVEAHILRTWYDTLDGKQVFEPQSKSGYYSSLPAFDTAKSCCFNEIKQTEYGTLDKPVVFSARGTIMHIKSDNVSYAACPMANCNKKIVESGNTWICEKCNRSFESPNHRYIISMVVADYSGQIWLQGFNDIGLVMFGMPANELLEIKKRDAAEYATIIHKVNRKTFNFVCRAKQNTYTEIARVNYVITCIQLPDYKKEAMAMRDLLRSVWAR